MLKKIREIRLLFPVFISVRARVSHILVLFLTFFVSLVIYNPFGGGTISESTLIQTILSSALVSMLYSIIASISMWAYSPKISKKRFRIFDYIVMVFLNTLISSLIYALGSTNIYDYVESFMFVGVIVIIPYVISVFYSYSRYLLKELVDKRNILEMSKESKREMIGFTDEYGKLDFYLDRESILYVEANDNYVNIYFESNSKVSYKILRSTLKSIELLLEKYKMIKCHRSYIVNMDQVIMTHKEKGKLKLELRNCAFLIPVSTSFAPLITDYIANSSQNS